MQRGSWWQPPQLILSNAEGERRVSWLELFFDLVFVVVIAQLTHELVEHPSWAGVGRYILLFVPVWWVWIGGTFYNSRFETQDVSYRLITFMQMLPVVGLALFSHQSEHSDQGFALSYAAARTLIIVQWFRGGWHEPLMRPITNRYNIGFCISVALFGTSVFVPAPWRYAMWGLGLLIDLTTPITTLKLQARIARLSNEKLPERFGLFVIIVLGEAIVGAINGFTSTPTLLSGVTGTMGMALTFGIWWVYFDFIARRLPRPNVWVAFAWSYLHLPLVMGIAALSAGVVNLIEHSDAHLPVNVTWLVCGAVAVVLLTISLLELTLRREADEPTHPRLSPALKALSALLALLAGALGPQLGALGLLGMLLTIFVLNMVYGSYVWFTQAPTAVPEKAL